MQLLGLATALVACGKPAPQTPRTLDLPALRAEAEAAPRDAGLQRALAEAEMFHPQGEPARAASQLATALELAPGDPRLHLLAAVRADAHGKTSAALDRYLAALRALSTSPSSSQTDAKQGPLGPHMAEFAVQSLASLEGGVEGYRERVTGALAAALPGLPTPARWAASDLATHLAFASGDRAAIEQLVRDAGCVTGFVTAGPFGPLDLLEFDRDHGVDMAAPLAASYDLGPGRGRRPSRELGARGCTVNLGGDPLALGGVRYATTQVQVASAGDYLLRLDTPNTVALYLDGEPVLTVDRRHRTEPRVQYLPLALSAGTHRLSLKLASRHPDPALRLSLLPMQDADERAIALPPKRGGGFPLYLRATLQLLRGDPVGARLSLAGVTAGAPASTYLLTQRANALFNDPLGPNDVRQDQARQLLLAALRKDSGLWNPTLQLASLASNNGRTDEAIEALRKARERFPAVPAIGLTLVQMLEERGWFAEADRIILDLRREVPDACAPLLAELSMLRRRSREPEAAALTEEVMACNAMSNARYLMLTRKRDWPAAKAELERLASMEPPQAQFSWQLGRLELARRTGSDQAAIGLIRDLRQRYPRFQGAVVDALDWHLARGQQESAADALDTALTQEPGVMADLWRLRPLVGKETALADFRRDGLAAIAAYEESGRSYSEPQVLVFDYMATRLFEDGSAVELVHTVQQARSDEAVDALAEVEVPEGARLLTLRTVKADGRLLEPDLIAGKDTLSLPGMEVGDYVEMEFIQVHEPSRAFPDGYLGSRFYFTSFEIPFDHSEMVYVTPPSMKLETDPRGPAPQAVTQTHEGLKVVRWVVEQSQPLVAEPGSVPPREYIPSTRVAYRTSWTQFVDSLREILVDRDVYDPALAELAGEIVGEAAPDDHALRARRLYNWVLDNVDNNNDSFSQAAVMLRARTGNAARVLHYLLGLAGVPSELALVRSATADVTPTEMPDTDTYDHLLVRVGTAEDPIWLFTNERHASFGFVPRLFAGQPARLLAEGAPVVRLPEQSTEQAERSIDVSLELAADGSARAAIREVLTGSAAISWRNQLEATPAAELKRRFEQEYLARLIPGARLRELQVAGRGREHESLTLQYSLEVASFARPHGEGWTVPPMLTTQLAANYAQLSSRSTTLMVAQPLSLDLTYRFRFPEGAARPQAPPPASLRGPDGNATFTQTAAYENGVLVLRRRIRVPIMRVPPERYPAFAEFCRQVDTFEATEFAFRPRE